MNSGGTVVIMEQTEATSPGNLARAVSRLQALTQLNISGGTTYSAAAFFMEIDSIYL